MKRRKPDLLLILIVLFGLGFIATNYSHAFLSTRNSATLTEQNSSLFFNPNLPNHLS